MLNWRMKLIPIFEKYPLVSYTYVTHGIGKETILGAKITQLPEYYSFGVAFSDRQPMEFMHDRSVTYSIRFDIIRRIDEAPLQ